MSKADIIMLRFRPIAHKPYALSPMLTLFQNPRIQKKPLKNNIINKRCNRRRITVPPLAVVILPLLPETPDPKDPLLPSSAKNTNKPVCLSFENHETSRYSRLVLEFTNNFSNNAKTTLC